MSRSYCITSAIVFALVGLSHAWRFVLDLPLQIGVWNVPRSLSGFAAIVAAVMAVWAFRSASSRKPARIAYS
jgi:hypothetical protein